MKETNTFYLTVLAVFAVLGAVVSLWFLLGILALFIWFEW